MLRHSRRQRRRLMGWRLWARRVLLSTLAVIVVLTGLLVIPALLAPGNDSAAARVAEAARDHGLGSVVTALESLQYRLSPPRTGGALDPSAASALPSGPPPAPATASTSGAAPSPANTPADVVALQPPIAPIDTPGLRGEGIYVPKVISHGQPALQVALLRPDAQHTSYLAGVAWMSSRLIRFVQHPGSTDPGHLSQWSQPATVASSARAGLAATFNSGFKTADSRGAFYADGATVGTFRRGAASLVVYDDGHVDIGTWGGEVTMTAKVRSVRQNLDLLIDGGRLTPAVDGDVQSVWGATIGSAAYVWRSGIGVTAAGDVVFVAGDALSARSLASMLQRAGAVRAMELDINKSWVSFMWYSAGKTPAAPVPHKLVDFVRPANRYFTVNNRDFFAAYLR